MAGATARLTGDDELLRQFNQLEAAATAELNMRRAAMAGALPIQNAGKEKAPKRTRTLSRSIHTEVLVLRRAYVEVGTGTDLEYAAIQEFGGEIKPKKGKYLAIPASRAGRQYVSPRQFPKPLHFKLVGGRPALVDQTDTVHYLLVRKVRIPAHPYMRPAYDEHKEEAIAEAGEVLRRLVERAAK